MKRWIPFTLGAACGLIHAVLSVEGMHVQAWALEAALTLLEKVYQRKKIWQIW
jgi:hypothetical protein